MSESPPPGRVRVAGLESGQGEREDRRSHGENTGVGRAERAVARDDKPVCTTTPVTAPATNTRGVATVEGATRVLTTYRGQTETQPETRPGQDRDRHRVGAGPGPGLRLDQGRTGSRPVAARGGSRPGLLSRLLCVYARVTESPGSGVT